MKDHSTNLNNGLEIHLATPELEIKIEYRLRLLPQLLPEFWKAVIGKLEPKDLAQIFPCPTRRHFSIRALRDGDQRGAVTVKPSYLILVGFGHWRLYAASLRDMMS